MGDDEMESRMKVIWGLYVRVNAIMRRGVSRMSIVERGVTCDV